jgi:hypothetical protein
MMISEVPCTKEARGGGVGVSWTEGPEDEREIIAQKMVGCTMQDRKMVRKINNV